MDKLRVPGTPRSLVYSKRRFLGLLALSLLTAIPLMGFQGGCGDDSRESDSSAPSQESRQAQKDAYNQANYNKREDARREREQNDYKQKVDMEHAKKGW